MGGFGVVMVVFVGLVLLIGGGITLGLLYYRHRCLRRVEAIAGAERRDVADLADGDYAKASGRVVALGEPLVSPLQRVPCVYFHFKVEEQRTRTVTTPGYGHGATRTMPTTRTETYWETVITDRQATDCAVADKTGSAQVDILDAETVLRGSGHTHTGLFADAPRHLERTLQRNYGYSTKGWFFNKSARYSETVLGEGDKVFVIGDVLVSRRGKACFVKGADPFIVSDKSEASLVGHYKTRALWSAIGAGVAAVFTLGLAAVPAAIAGFAAPALAQNPPPQPLAPDDDGNPFGPQGWNPNPAPNDPFANNPPAGPGDGPGIDPGQLRPNNPFPNNPFPNRPAPFPKKERRADPVPWKLTADPSAYKVTGGGVDVFDAPRVARSGITLPGGVATLVFPNGPSAFVLLSPPGRGAPPNAVQVCDLRTMRAVGPVFSARSSFHDRLVLSADGAHVAGRLDGAAAPTIEVWTSATGRSRRLELDQDATVFGQPIEFLGKDKLLTMKHVGHIATETVETTYQVWSLTTGKAVAEFKYPLRYDPRWGCVSPGGRYFVLEKTDHEGFVLLAWDLTTGKAAGEFEFQGKKEKWGQAMAVQFSPDGKELAMVWRQNERPDNWARVLVWDAATGQKVADHKLGFGVMPSADGLLASGGPTCLTWFPDGKGWVLYGHAVLDRATGALLGRMPGKAPTWNGDLPQKVFVGRGLVAGVVEVSPGQKGLTMVPVPTGK